MRDERRRSVVMAVALAGALAAHVASAQSFPSKPLRMIVPTSAGGNLDIVSRSVAQKLSEQLGQQVIVESRPGANGAIAAELVARAAPDAYTLLVVANSFVSTPGLVASVSYDPVRDFAGVSLMAWLPQALVVHPSVPARSVRELIALAQARPKQLINATQGEASTGRIAAELFTHMTRATFLHVAYKGGGPALIDLVGGQVSLMFATVSTVLPFVKSGRIRALGLTSKERSPAFPGVPTIAESGVPGYEAAIFNGVMAPAATPREPRLRLQREISRAVAIPELRARLLEQGVELNASESPEQWAEFIRSETDKHTRLWRSLGLQPQ